MVNQGSFQGNLVLCGFMGCGKSSVGKRVARLLQKKYVDVDQYIEKKEKMTVAKLFQLYGEAGFRQRETAAVEELSRQKNMVVACGGGTVLFPANVEALHKGGGVILLLDVPVAALQERLKGDKRRPLLQQPNRREVIDRLYRERVPQYLQAADAVIDAGAPAVVVAKRVVHWVDTQFPPASSLEKPRDRSSQGNAQQSRKKGSHKRRRPPQKGNPSRNGTVPNQASASGQRAGKTSRPVTTSTREEKDRDKSTSKK